MGVRERGSGHQGPSNIAFTSYSGLFCFTVLCDDKIRATVLLWCEMVIAYFIFCFQEKELHLKTGIAIKKFHWGPARNCVCSLQSLFISSGFS